MTVTDGVEVPLAPGEVPVWEVFGDGHVRPVAVLEAGESLPAYLMEDSYRSPATGKRVVVDTSWQNKRGWHVPTMAWMGAHRSGLLPDHPERWEPVTGLYN